MVPSGAKAPGGEENAKASQVEQASIESEFQAGATTWSKQQAEDEPPERLATLERTSRWNVFFRSMDIDRRTAL